jgi:hypothetical protein
MTKVAERMQTAGQSLEYTQEHARVGAIKGIITYADGTKVAMTTPAAARVSCEVNARPLFTGMPIALK